jgi:hypothetical protein
MDPDPNEAILKDYLAQFRESEGRARRAARRWTLVPLAVGALWLGVCLWQAEKARNQVEQSKADLVRVLGQREKAIADINDLNRQIKEKQEVLSKVQAANAAAPLPATLNPSGDAPQQQLTTNELAEQIDRFVVSKTKINAILDRSQAGTSQVTAEQVKQSVKVDFERTRSGKKAGSREPFNIRFALTGPKAILDQVDSVRYKFDESSFILKTKIGTSSVRNFEVRYLGWGCIDTVGVTVVFKGSGDEVALPGFPFCDQWEAALR